MRKRGKWSFVVIATMLTLLFLVSISGCARPPAVVEPPEEEPAEEPEEEVEEVDERFGGHLVATKYQVQDELDPSITTATSTMRFMRSVFDTLVWMREPNDFVPGLATDWDHSDDYTVWTFYLRDDVVFHNGDPFDAESVAFTFERISDPETGSLRAAEVRTYSHSEVINDYTVALHFSEPNPRFLWTASSEGFAPLSPKAVEELGDDHILYPVGTGPFLVDEWKDARTYVLRRFEDYNWAPDFLGRQGPAYLETLTVRMIEEDSTRVGGLEAGELHYIDNVPADDIVPLQEMAGFEVIQFDQAGSGIYLPINVTAAPTDSLKVRQAILYAVSTDIINDLVHAGLRNPGRGPITSATWGYCECMDEMYLQDEEKARALLVEDGYAFNESTGYFEKDGKTLEIDIVTSSADAAGGESELVQAMCEAVGIKTNLLGTAYEVRAEMYANNEYNIARFGWSTVDTYFVFNTAWHSSQVDEGGQFNRSRVKDPHVDALIEEAGRITDQERLLEIYHELQRYIMENAFVIPASEFVGYDAMSDEVQGYEVDTRNQPYWYNVWMR